jgi:hypothetical protein
MYVVWTPCRCTRTLQMTHFLFVRLHNNPMPLYPFIFLQKCDSVKCTARRSLGGCMLLGLACLKRHYSN